MTNIIFDCDSTLCSIEGIDILADRKNISEEVATLTNAAMDGDVPLDAVYEKRLSLIKPSYDDVMALSDDYIISLVDDSRYVVKTLLDADINVFIVSGGLYEPIARLASTLNIPAENVYAVKLNYPNSQPSQAYLKVEKSPLTTSDGKKEIVNEIMRKHPGNTVLIGDGSSDAVTKEIVDLFIGYGGIVKREKIEEIADVYFYQHSLLPLLAFSQNQDIKRQLIHDHKLQSCQELMQDVKISKPAFQFIVDDFFEED